MKVKFGGRTAASCMIRTAIAVFALVISAPAANADLDGHGPDSWRVSGVAPNDVLNARMGPGTNYRVIERFAHDERGLQQITCIPFYTMKHFSEMTEAEIKALPPRWCLMRSADMTKAGWVAQRYITPDDTEDSMAVSGRVTTSPASVSNRLEKANPGAAGSGDAMIAKAVQIVRDLYEAQVRAERGQGEDPLFGNSAGDYFTADIVEILHSRHIEAHPLWGAQDFDGHVTRIAPDSDSPMYRGMITVNVDFVNFGANRRAIHYLRADTSQPGAPLRIIGIEHDGWSFP